MKKFITTFIISALFISNLSGQNYFLSEEESALIFQGNYSDNDGVRAFGITPSINANGKLSFGVSLQRFNSKPSNGYKTTPFVSYLFLKKARETDIVNLGLGVHYSYESIDGDKSSSNIFGVGPEFSYQFILENDFRITLGTAIYLGKSKFEYRNYYNELSTVETSFSLKDFIFLINLRHKKTFFEFAVNRGGYSGKHSDYYVSEILFGFSLGYIIF